MVTGGRANMREPTSSARTPSSLWLRLALAKLALGSAAFHTIDSNEDLMIGVAFSPLSSDALFAGGGRSGNTINPMVGSGLLVTRDNGSHWALETPGDGAYANPFPMAIVVASNKESESGTVCAAGIASTWCSANTSTRDATSFLRAPILTVNGTSGNFADLKWEPTGGAGDGIFQVTGQFGTQQNWTNGIAVSFDNAQTWTLRSADALTAPAFASATPSADVWYTTAGSVPATDDEDEDEGSPSGRRPVLPRSLRRVARFLGPAKWRELWRSLGGEKHHDHDHHAADPPPAPSANYVGQVAKTTDGGKTWSLVLENDGGVSGGANFTFDDIHCFDEQTCVVAANGGCGSSSANVCDGSQPRNMGGAVWVTTDGGATFTETLRDNEDPTFGFSNLRMVGQREAYAVGGTMTVSRSSGVHVWHTMDVTDPSAWVMTLVTADIAQLSMGLDILPSTGELVINVIQKDVLCGLVRGFTDDHPTKMAASPGLLRSGESATLGSRDSSTGAKTTVQVINNHANEITFDLKASGAGGCYENNQPLAPGETDKSDCYCSWGTLNNKLSVHDPLSPSTKGTLCTSPGIGSCYAHTSGYSGYRCTVEDVPGQNFSVGVPSATVTCVMANV